MSKNIVIYIGLLLFLLNCKKERSDLLPHILIDVGYNETLRIDYYQSGDYLMIYFNDNYKDREKLFESYAKAIGIAKSTWCFKILDFTILSSFEVDEAFIIALKKITERISNEDVFLEEGHQKGFVLKLNNRIGNCDSRDQ